MQAGHLPLALSIASYDWSPETAAFCVAMHWLPNGDSLVVKAGLAKPDFHCSVTHSILFAVVVSAFVALFSTKFAVLALVAILAHYAADIGSTVGLPLLWPLNKQKYTMALFEDTGWWGRDMFIGYYRQPMSWVLEGSITLFFIYRMSVIYN